MKYFNSIKKKLTSGILLIISLTLILIIGGMIIIGFYNKNSEKLIIEYHELNVLHEYKSSLNYLFMQLNNQQISKDSSSFSEIRHALSNCSIKFKNCSAFVTDKHKDEVWSGLEIVTNKIQNAVTETINKGQISSPSNFEKISGLINAGIVHLNHLIAETGEEINQSEQFNSRAIRHGTYTMLAFGITVILLLFFGGMQFIQKLTQPIRELVIGAELIKSGERKSRVQVQSNDEFKKLADAFNSMLDSLDETTVDKEYFRSIVNNLYGALFLLDNNGFIRLVNKTVIKLFEFTEEEMLNNSFEVLLIERNISTFPQQFAALDFEQKAGFFNRQNILLSKSGKAIPVLITCTRLKRKSENADEMLIVAHDITEKVSLEQQLEQKRNEARLAINEAQEAERLRLATDLHDGLGQQLTGISLMIQKLTDSGKFPPQEVQSIRDQIDSSIREMRRLAHDLIPKALVEFGLINALHALVERANKIGQTKFQFFHYDISERLDPKMEKAIYRICQEAINNILKHARAANASIQLLYNVQQLTIVIDDDGVGIAAAQHSLGETNKNKGIGLLSIRERVNYFSGTLTIESNPGEGTEMIIEMPFPKSS